MACMREPLYEKRTLSVRENNQVRVCIRRMERWLGRMSEEGTLDGGRGGGEGGAVRVFANEFVCEYERLYVVCMCVRVYGKVWKHFSCISECTLYRCIISDVVQL